MEEFLELVDRINEWVGRVTAMIVPLIMLIVSLEVVMRYVFNSPTIWAWDVNTQLFALVVFMSGGYTLMNKGHVNIDLFYGRLSTKSRAWVDLITSPIFFVFMGILLWKLGEMAWQSVEELEVMSTIFEPPIYPLKVLITIGTFLFFLQGVAAFIRNLKDLAKKGVRGPR